MPVETDSGTLLQAMIALIAIANPFAALPVFLSLVSADDPAARRAAANRVALAVFAILTGAVLIGRPVLAMFGVSFAAFRVGGGLVVTLTGLDMLRRRDPMAEEDAAATALSAADQLIVPVAKRPRPKNSLMPPSTSWAPTATSTRPMKRTTIA